MSAAFPLWVNDIPALAELQRRSHAPSASSKQSIDPSSSSPSSSASSSLMSIRDVFRCNIQDPEECWQYVLLSSYMTDLEWLLTAVPELSAVTKRVVMLSGDRGTATLRRSDLGKYTPTSEALNRVNPFLGALHTVAQRRRDSGPTASSSSLPVLTQDRFTVLEPPLPIAFGTHHTKMAVCVNRRGVRICIFTANLLEQDWCWKTQGIYMQDFPWWTASASAQQQSNVKARDFEGQLRHYWKHCGLDMTAPFSWEASQSLPLGIFNTDFLSCVDFTAAKVWLVSSVPGTHVSGEASPGYSVGLCRLAEVLQRVGPAPSPETPVVLTWQYSSQGSLNPAFLHTLQAAMCGATALITSTSPKSAAALDASPAAVQEVQIIYPTEAEVRNSLEGWRGGASLPVRLQCCHEFVNVRLHRWGGERSPDALSCAPHKEHVHFRHDGRESAVDVDASDDEEEREVGVKVQSPMRTSACRRYAMPHIKSYAAMDAARMYLHWYLLTSANLSQAAWGSLSGKPAKNTQRRLLLRSYELGVVYDQTSVVETSASCSWFSVVRASGVHLPTTANSAASLFPTPMGGRSTSTVAAPLLFLPCNMLRPAPYASTAALRAARGSSSPSGIGGVQPPLSALSCRDIPWVLDIPHGGLDAYGRTAEEAFSADSLPLLSRWRPQRENGGDGARGNAPVRKRTRD